LFFTLDFYILGINNWYL